MSTRDPRLEAITAWLDCIADNPLTGIRPASEDASFRRYFRVDDENNGSTLIVMDAPPEKEDTAPFVHVTDLLRGAGVHAPRILARETAQGFLLMEDLGTRTYLDHLADDTDAMYRDAIDTLVRMQTIEDGLPDYDADRLMKEMGLFEEWYVGRHHGMTLTAEQKAILDITMVMLIESALEQPRVFVHRDYHSRNLMLTADNNPGVIDYQDAVVGPVTYDLVSLFKDCYIEWPRERVEGWLDEYLEQSPLEIGRDEFRRWFDFMGVQRHLKVLGIFSRLNHRDGKSQYLDDLPLTLKYVLDTCERYEELQPLGELLVTIA